MTDSQVVVTTDVNQDGEETLVSNNVTQATMEETVQRNAALTVFLPVYVTVLQENAPEDVNQDGQEANVTNNVGRVITVKIVVRNAA